MLSKRIISFGLVLLASGALTGRCLAGVVYNFQYSLPAPPDSSYDAVSAYGTLTTGDFDLGIGGYLVSSIEGTRTVNGVDTLITGLIPPGGFGGNSNVLYYPDAPFLDVNGLSFTIDNPVLSNDGLGNVNIYFYFGSDYTEISNLVGYGTFDVALATQELATPEPSTAMLLIGGLLAVAAWTRKPRQFSKVPARGRDQKGWRLGVY
jgi:hypothetical protein